METPTPQKAEGEHQKGLTHPTTIRPNPRNPTTNPRNPTTNSRNPTTNPRNPTTKSPNPRKRRLQNPNNPQNPTKKPKNQSESKKNPKTRDPTPGAPQVGSIVPCVITKIGAYRLSVKVGPMSGVVHISEIDEGEDPDVFELSRRFSVGQKIERCRILRSSGTLLMVSLRQVVLEAEDLESVVRPLSDANVKMREIYPGWVISNNKEEITLCLSSTVVVMVLLTDISFKLEDIEKRAENLPVAKRIQCIPYQRKERLLYASIKAVNAPAQSISYPWDLKGGSITLGRICSVELRKGIKVQLFPRLIGFVDLTDITDDYQANPTEEYVKRIGEVLPCYLLDTPKRQFVRLSLRPSRISPETVVGPLRSPEIKEISDLIPGQIVQGYVVKNENDISFIKLNRKLHGTASLSFLKKKNPQIDPQLFFPVGKLVSATVISVETSPTKIWLSLNLSKQIYLSELKPGTNYSGVVSSIIDHGLFIKIKGCSILGYCRASEVCDTKLKPNEIKSKYSVGDKVRVRVLSVDIERERIELSMKPDYFVYDSESEEEEKFLVDNDLLEEMKVKEIFEKKEETSNKNVEMQVVPELESESESKEESQKENETNQNDRAFELASESDEEKKSSPNVKPLTTGSLSFDWGSKLQFTSSKLDSDEESDEAQASIPQEDIDEDGRDAKRKHKKSVQEKEETAEIEIPKTADDFEKLLLSNGQQSFVWIQYMAFWIGRMMLPKARETAKRALQRIDPSKEKEKMDIWVAYLNMENSFGTRETFLEVFKEALQYNDQKQIYFHAIRIFRQSNDDEMVRNLFKNLTSKYKSHKSVWIKNAIYLYRTDKATEARTLLKRSLTSLPNRKHVATITKFAHLEYKFGSIETARTLFEDLISTFPKRIDIYTTFIDQESKFGELEKVRNLYDRVTSLNLSTKKMKYLLKRFLAFEKNHGTTERVNYVEAKALEYVQGK